jgi:hypothetical protein
MDLQIALTQQQLGLPDPQTFVTGVENQAFPHILNFATIALGLSLAVMLFRSWNK